MNKRIKELAEQAELDATLLFNKEKLERFSALLIDECLNELCNQMDLHGVDLSNLPSWYKALEQTEKYFRIEK